MTILCMLPGPGLSSSGRARPGSGFSPQCDCEQVVRGATYLFILQGERTPSHRSLEIFVECTSVSNSFSFPLARCACACADTWGQGRPDSTRALRPRLRQERRGTGEFQRAAKCAWHTAGATRLQRSKQKHFDLATSPGLSPGPADSHRALH